MGEARRDALRVGFDRAIKLEFHGAKVSSDAGLFPYRDLDEAAQLTDSGAAELFDFRTGTNVQHGMTALLRQSVYSRLAGYEDVNDAERLSVDPVMRRVVGGRALDRTAASTSQVGRFETEVLTDPDNLAALMAMPGQWVDRIHEPRPMKKLILDMDSSVSETYGQQEGSMYNGHFACECYHPLFIFNHDGDVELALLRNGNVASADDWRSALEPVIERYRDVDVPKFFRDDAAFAILELYDLLEAEGYEYVIRLKANQVLERHIGHMLSRPVGRPPKPSPAVLRQLRLPGEVVGPPAPRGVQGRVASRRVVSARRLHRDQPRRRVQVRGGLLQRSRNHRAADQGGQARDPLDASELPWLRRQPGAAATACAGVQPGQLPAPAGAAAECEAVVAHDAARQADQDRCEDGSSRPIRHVSTGRGRSAASAVPGDP